MRAAWQALKAQRSRSQLLPGSYTEPCTDLARKVRQRSKSKKVVSRPGVYLRHASSDFAASDYLRVWEHMQDGWVVGSKFAIIDGEEKEIANGLVPLAYLSPV